jgi:hypothetical protein
MDLVTILPIVFMMVMTIWSLVGMIVPFVKSLLSAGQTGRDVIIAGICGTVLLVLGLMLIFETVRTIWMKKGKA